MLVLGLQLLLYLFFSKVEQKEQEQSFLFSFVCWTEYLENTR